MSGIVECISALYIWTNLYVATIRIDRVRIVLAIDVAVACQKFTIRRGTPSAKSVNHTESRLAEVLGGMGKKMGSARSNDFGKQRQQRRRIVAREIGGHRRSVRVTRSRGER
ncbi:MAG: hypothetical protein M3R60_06095 [Pseudomonadota bacterium]|nr:hypothetical protein [Pseudomonadota bacterium]